MGQQPVKPWYQSRSVWGGLAAVAAALGTLFGLDIDTPALTEILLALGGVIGGAVAVYGRVKAERPIRRKGLDENEDPYEETYGGMK